MSRDMFHPMRRATAIAVLAVLGACASSPTSAPVRSSRSRGSAPLPKPTLAQEQQRLSELFSGTPVVLAIDRDGSLRAEVPLRYCFDPARAIVKAPLAAVLDRLAGSPATGGGAWLVAAPGDPKGKGFALALERAASARDYLVARGADAARFSISAQGGGASAVVRIVAGLPAAPAAR